MSGKKLPSIEERAGIKKNGNDLKYLVKSLFTTVRRLAGDTQGVTLVEYGIAIALAIFVGIAVLFPILATDISGAMGAAGAAMSN